MVSAATTATTTAATTNSLFNTVKKAKGIKALGLCGAISACMSIFDFMEVPSAFSIKNDYEGKPIEGTNYEAGIKETLWSGVKCASAFTIPWLIGTLAAPFAPVAATIATAVKYAAPLISYPILEKIRPHEKEVIEKICQAKANNPDNIPASAGTELYATA